jgi:hypothetical protein
VVAPSHVEIVALRPSQSLRGRIVRRHPLVPAHIYRCAECGLVPEEHPVTESCGLTLFGMLVVVDPALPPDRLELRL